MKRFGVIMVIIVCLLPLILYNCSKYGSRDGESLANFRYKTIKRKVLILPITGRGDKTSFIEVQAAIKNTLDNHFIVIQDNRKFKATRSKDKALKYCAKAEADIVMILSYHKTDESFIFNVNVYSFEDKGRKKLSRSFSGVGSEFIAKLTDFLNKDLYPSMTKRYPKVYKGRAPSGVQVLFESQRTFPDWINNIPLDNQYQYFVGEVGGMRNKQRASREAINEALWNIALGVEAIVEGVQKHSSKERVSAKNQQLVKEFKSDLRITTRVTLRGAKVVKRYFRQVQLPDRTPTWEYYVLMRYPRKKIVKKIVYVVKKAKKKAKKKGMKKFRVAREIIKSVEHEIVENDSSLTESIKVKTRVKEYVPVAADKKSSRRRRRKIAYAPKDMVKIPGGIFVSGRDGQWDDNPTKRREMRGFYLDQYEVTVKDYRKVMRKLPPDKPSWGWKDDHPVVKVTWNEAKNYCKKLGKRLPTEWEWEYAATGPEHYIWANGNSFNPGEYCCSSGKYSKDSTCPVGTYRPNGYGLYDMSGNATEWTASWYNTDERTDYVLRGGSWGDSNDYDFCVTVRYSNTYSDRVSNNGFRCAQSVE